MVEENRKFLFKEPDCSLTAIRANSRNATLDKRKSKREKVVSTKRFRCEHRSYLSATDEEKYTVESVTRIAKEFQEKSSETQTQLKYLRNAFSFSGDFVNAFLTVNNSLYTLVGYLTGHDAILQLEAAWCITNISANENEHMFKVVKATAPYLITYLRGGSALLQDQSAWALGNMAADCNDVRTLLKAQGVISPLVQTIQSDVDAVVQSSLFALCNMSRNLELVITEFKNCDLWKLLLKKLSTDHTDMNVLGEVAWLLSYLCHDKLYCDLLLENGLLQLLVHWMCKVRPHQLEYLFLVTPLLRCLGNILGAACEVDVESLLHYENGLLLSSLNDYLLSHKPFLIKECLWVISNLLASDMKLDVHENDLKVMLQNIIGHLTSAYDIKKEAAICMCSLAHRGELFMNALTGKATIESFINFFKIPDVDMIFLALKYFQYVLPDDTASHLFYDMEGPSYLEALEFHENEQVRTAAVYLQKTHFEHEDQLDTS